MMDNHGGEPFQVSPEGRKCSALSLSDKKPCLAPATSLDSLFCRYHAKQCFGLYKGYKKRNAHLDDLSAAPPSYLANSGKKLANEDFSNAEDEDVLGEVHHYLYMKYCLLDRVIRARKVHHEHFYAQTMDYGHEKFLNSLITDKRTVRLALERCTARISHLANQKRKWFKWAKACQEEENMAQEKEEKKLKREAALFRRQAKELDRLKRELREKEDARKEQEFLDQLHNNSKFDGSEDWDPIEDVLEIERETYVKLIRYCLWLDASDAGGVEDVLNDLTIRNDEAGQNDIGLVISQPANESDEVSGEAATGAASQPGSKSQNSKTQTPKKKKKAKGKGKKQAIPQQKISEATPEVQSAPENAGLSQAGIVRTGEHGKQTKQEPDMSCVETKQELQNRLVQGTKIGSSKDFKIRICTPSGPFLSDRMPGMLPAEAARLTSEIAEIRIFLLCRILLKNAVLLPQALEANSVDEFLSNAEVKAQDLRDLCLKLEDPQLQDIRDACADFFRDDDEESDLLSDTDESEGETDEEPVYSVVKKTQNRKHPLPEIWRSKREKQLKVAKAQGLTPGDAIKESMKQTESEPGTRIDFGVVNDAGVFKKANVRVKVCGRTIYNYPKEGSMSRKGWLHFSIIAKDCSLHKAAELCKSWDEFSELNTLASHVYFPSPHWAEWVDNMVKSQLLRFGFVPYYNFDDADAASQANYLRSQGKRGQVIYQVRNYVCAHMRRNDPVSRRFIQYCFMQASRIMILVRDGKTGKIIVSPPESELWLARVQVGFGRRADEAHWQTLQHVGEDFFEEMDEKRSYGLGFTDFYDIYIWTADPGSSWEVLYAALIEMLCKARRVCHILDTWAGEAHILKTLTIECETGRVRDIVKGEEIASIWDDMSKGPTAFRWISSTGESSVEVPRSLAYTEADALEDAILFPQDSSKGNDSRRFKSIENELTRFEEGQIDTSTLARFIGGIDTDEEIPSDVERKAIQLKTESLPKIEHNDEMKDDDDDSWEDLTSSQSETDSEHVSGAPQAVAHQGPLERFVFGGYRTLEAADRVLSSFSPHPERDIDVEYEFQVHMDLSKSNIFKQTWHKCDFEPGAQEKWQIYLALRADAEKDINMSTDLLLPCAHLLKFLNYHPETHLRVMKDARRAYAIVALYSQLGSRFLKTKRGSRYATSTLFDAEERRRHLPDRRGFQSTRFRDISFYAELKKARKAAALCSHDNQDNLLPLEWDLVMRPKIAQFFHNGLIGVSYVPEGGIAGSAFAAKEGDRPLDLFFDFRKFMADLNIPPTMVNPYDITISSLRQEAERFASTNPKARYSLLRIWSAPHFYPFMIGYDNRYGTSFKDAIGRCWEWKFIPKDMPYSEFSTHKNVGMRLDPVYRALGKDKYKVRHRKDVILVMGCDEDELIKLTAGATFAVQTQPWRLEIDFWKSFINVDVKFMESLQEEWWA